VKRIKEVPESEIAELIGEKKAALLKATISTIAP
jgi:hypothetical protein